MYNNNCVIAILHKGNVLREHNGEVHLPFGSSYKIRAKNNGWGRVKVKVKIDGSYIHPDNQAFVINANSQMDLERMITNGNLNSGPRLKFVELSDGRVQDPTSKENGVVEVSFYRERMQPVQPFIYDINNTYIGDTSRFGEVTCDSYDTVAYSSQVNHSLINNNGGSLDRLSSRKMKSSNGATVGGSKSKQGFSLSEDFDTELIPTVLTLKMFGINEPNYVKNTRNKFCDSCGRKNRFKAKFCSQCGRRI